MIFQLVRLDFQYQHFTLFKSKKMRILIRTNVIQDFFITIIMLHLLTFMIFEPARLDFQFRHSHLTFFKHFSGCPEISRGKNSLPHTTTAA